MRISELKQIIENYNDEAARHSRELQYSREISYTNGPESGTAKRELGWREQRLAAARPPVFNIGRHQYTADQISRLADNDNQSVDEVVEKVRKMNTL